MKKNRNIKFLLSFILSIIILSCAYEEDLIKNHNHSEKFKIEQVKYNELIKTNLFNQAVKRIPKKKVTKTNEFGRTIVEDTYGFTIIDTPVKIIEYDGKTTYTLQIIRDENIDGQLENLVLYDQIIDNSIGYIIKYNVLKSVSKTEREIMEDGIDETITLTLSGTSSTNRQSISVTYVTCPCAQDQTCYCGGNPENSNYEAGCSTTVFYLLSPLGTSVTGNWGDGGSSTSTSGGGGPDPNGPSTYDGSDPNIHGNGSTSPTSCPTCTEIDNEEEQETPCEELNDLKNKPNIQSALYELEDEIANTPMGNVSDEASFMLDIAPNESVTLRKAYGSQGMVKVKVGQKSFGALHVHNLGIDPMFDPGDLLVICKMANSFVPAPPDHPDNYYNPTIFFNTMVVNGYAYAVVPNDIAAFKTKCAYLNNNWKRLNLKIQMEFKKIKKEGLTNQLDFAKVFLDFINNPNDSNLNFNVSLYRISTSPINQNNWKKLTLDSTKLNGISEDACN